MENVASSLNDLAQENTCKKKSYIHGRKIKYSKAPAKQPKRLTNTF